MADSPSDAPSPSPAPEPSPTPEASPAAQSTFAKVRAWWKRRREAVESNWQFLDGELHRGRLLTVVLLLHLRYTFGYLAFGFMVSAPLQLAYRSEWGDHLLKSIVLGSLCVVPFVCLWPFTRIDWGRMRVPEFMNLELALTRWATVLALAFLIFSGVVRLFAGHSDDDEAWWVWVCDVRVAYLTLGLMFFAWIRVKFNTLLFREFYTLTASDDLVLRVPPSQLMLDLTPPRPGGDEAPQEPKSDPSPPSQEPNSDPSLPSPETDGKPAL